MRLSLKRDPENGMQLLTDPDGNLIEGQSIVTEQTRANADGTAEATVTVTFLASALDQQPEGPIDPATD